jgi:hypothetical protein
MVLRLFFRHTCSHKGDNAALDAILSFAKILTPIVISEREYKGKEMTGTEIKENKRNPFATLIKIILLLYAAVYIFSYGYYFIVVSGSKSYQEPYDYYGQTIFPCQDSCTYNGRLFFTKLAYVRWVTKNNLTQSKYFKKGVKNTFKGVNGIIEEESLTEEEASRLTRSGEHNPRAALVIGIVYLYILFLNNDFVGNADEVLGTCYLPEDGFYVNIEIGNWLIPHWVATCY